MISELCKAFGERFAGDEKPGEAFDFGKWMIYCKLMYINLGNS